MARSLSQRVISGAKFLDKKVPGWERKVKRTKLIMSSNTDCVLGQLANGECAIRYGESLGLNMENGDAIKYGFEEEEGVENKEHIALWQKEIKTRLGIKDK